jgi:hypothetical protein
VAPKITSRRFPPPWTVEDIGAAFVTGPQINSRLLRCDGSAAK